MTIRNKVKVECVMSDFGSYCKILLSLLVLLSDHAVDLEDTACL